MTEASNEIRAIALSILCAGALVTGIRSCVTQHDNLLKRPLPTIADLMRVFSTFPLSDRFQIVRSSDRSFIVSIGAIAQIKERQEDLQRLLSDGLTQNDWTIRETSDGEKWRIHLCKRGIETAIRMETYQKTVYISISLTYDATTSDCPK